MQTTIQSGSNHYFDLIFRALLKQEPGGHGYECYLDNTTVHEQTESKQKLQNHRRFERPLMLQPLLICEFTDLQIKKLFIFWFQHKK
jgi:hypothetical protein